MRVRPLTPAFRGAYPRCIGEGRTQFQLCVGTR